MFPLLLSNVTDILQGHIVTLSTIAAAVGGNVCYGYNMCPASSASFQLIEIELLSSLTVAR